MNDGFPPPVAATIAWLRQAYGNYYDAHPIKPPDRFTRREFGFILWPERPGPPPFLRHRAYRQADALHDWMARRGPHSAYYSTAYYRQPSAAKMVDKQWLGAELIFDLDADHLKEAEEAAARGEPMPLPAQLDIVKDQFRRLLDEFLFGDFGLDPKDVVITFSGGRGYHAHVMTPALMALDARSRREIVDYVTGKVPVPRGSSEPDLSAFVWEKAVGVRGRGEFARPQMAQFIHPADAPGWQGRLTRALVQALREEVLQAERSQARQWLMALDGVGPKKADDVLDHLTDEKVARIEKGYLEQGTVVKQVAKHVLRQQALPLSRGETDEPVTADVKRLIRLPGSLHGKSGLRVVTLDRDALDDFDPFRDAVAFPMTPIGFTPRGDDTVTLGGETVSVAAGQATDVPMAHAVFWAGRQQGTIAAGDAQR